MLSNKINSFNYCYSSLSNNNTNAASTNFGRTVTSGNAGVKGAWTNLMPSTYSYIDPGDSTTQVLSKDCYFLEIIIGEDSSNTPVGKPCIADFGVDSDGGSNFKIKIKDLIVGPAGFAYNSSNIVYKFPIYIKAGSSIGMRIQSETTGTRNFRVGIRYFGLPSNKESIFTGNYIETIGQSGVGGTSFTFGENVYGAWASLGTTTKKLSYWNLGVTFNNSAIVARTSYINFAYGTHKKIIIPNMFIFTTSVERIGYANMGVYHTIPAGTELFVQGATVTVSSMSGFSAMAYGVG